MYHNPPLNIQPPEFLYRVIRTYDVDPETGFQCGNPFAGLTFEQHVKKGFDNVIKSQYISTTKSSWTAISWTLKEHSSFAIISCQALNQDIYGYDLSTDRSPILDEWSNDISTRHQEILLTPYINEEAIVGIVSFEDCPSRDSMRSRVQRLLGLCGYCNRRGHDIDHCVQRSRGLCGYCNRRGHDIDHCVQRSRGLCGYCNRRGHDIDHCEEPEVDYMVDKYYSTRCGYCNEPGHDVDKGDRCEELAVDCLVDKYYSTLC